MQSNQTPNAPSVQQTRELLTALVNAQYPEVKSLKVKKDGKLFFDPRQIQAPAYQCLCAQSASRRNQIL